MTVGKKLSEVLNIFDLIRQMYLNFVPNTIIVVIYLLIYELFVIMQFYLSLFFRNRATLHVSSMTSFLKKPLKVHLKLI